jgi:hypothetical protein
MSHAKVKPAGWGSGDELTHAEISQLDTNVSESLDKTSAGDTIEGAITLSGAGRFIAAEYAATDANETYVVTDARRAIYVSGLTASRNKTLSNTGATAGDTIIFRASSSLAYPCVIKNHGGTTIFTLGTDGAYASFVHRGGNWELQSNKPILRSQTFTANGTFTVPANVSEFTIIGIGGGGGGGGGAGGDSTSRGSIGGGGGGAARKGQVHVTAAAATMAVTIGTAGAAGAAGTAGADGGAGGDGGDTTVVNGGSTYTFYGAEGGYAGLKTTSWTAAANAVLFVPGGRTRAGSIYGRPIGLFPTVSAVSDLGTKTCCIPQRMPSEGGHGIGFTTATAADVYALASALGQGSETCAGSTPGSAGANTPYVGGGFGGGGGSSNWSAASIGGNGGNGYGSTGVAGSAGSAGAGYGSGGGGGGGGTQLAGPTSTVGYAGGAGTGGAVTFIWVA